MKPFTHLASFYDLFMEHVDYERWAGYVESILRRYGVRGRKILGLACGTGSLALILSGRGYKVVGVDTSWEMVKEGRRKAQEGGGKVEFIQGDMRDFQWKGSPFDIILCLYDSLNYILNLREVEKVFKGAFNLMDERGILIFDVITEKNLLSNFDGKVLAKNYPNFSYIWENNYHRKRRICESALTLFIKDEDIYRKKVEHHNQRIYSIEELLKLLRKVGFTIVDAFKGFSFEQPDGATERVNFVASKNNRASSA